jgi:hypothetical protein
MVDYLLLNRTHSVAVYVSAHWWKVCNFMVMDIVYVKQMDQDIAKLKMVDAGKKLKEVRHFLLAR